MRDWLPLVNENDENLLAINTEGVIGNTSKEALEGALQKNPKLKPSDVALYFVPDANEMVL